MKVLPLFGLLIASNLYAQTGMLLGTTQNQEIVFHVDISGGDIDRLQTQWYIIDGDSSRHALTLPQVIVPRDSGFWKVGLKRSLYNNVIEDFMWSLPASEIAEISGIDQKEGEYCDELVHGKRLNFVGNDFMSVRHWGYGMCEWKMSPTNYARDHWHALDTNEDIGGGYYSSLFSDDVYKSISAQAKRFWEHIDNSNNERDMVRPESESEGIRLGKKGWEFFGRLAANGWVNRGAEIHFPLELDVDIKGVDRFQVDWEFVDARHSNARHAFSSPKGDLVAVVTNGGHRAADSLYIYRQEEGVLSPKPLGRHAFFEKSIVMIQWAYGGHVERWDHALLELEKESYKWRGNDWKRTD